MVWYLMLAPLCITTLTVFLYRAVGLEVNDHLIDQVSSFAPVVCLYLLLDKKFKRKEIE